MDVAVRDWGRAHLSAHHKPPTGVAGTWWTALWAVEGSILASPRERRELAALYEAGMVAWRGQTLGKMLLRLRIVRRTDGARPTPGEALVRYAVPTVWLLLPLPLVGQLMWMVVYLSSIPNVRRQGWHDKAASTLVVVA